MEFLHSLHRLDSRLFVAIFCKAENRYLRIAARTLSRSADGYLHFLVPLLLYIVGAPHVDSLVTLIIASLVLERPLYWVLKNSLRRPRPADRMVDIQSLIVAGDRFSFPSGHTSAAFLLATALAVTYEGVGLWIFVWAGAIGVSRVVLGVHYPGDTVSGALMGSALVLFISAQL